MEAKQAFEQYTQLHGIAIKHIHCDSGRFANQLFKQHVKASHQMITFCGINAHHQNGRAEWRICNITEASYTMLLHAAQRWPKAIVSNLWPQALKHALNIQNSVPRVGRTFSPLSKFAGTPVEPNLQHLHPFGCPFYMLENPLQGRKLFPKGKAHTCVGIYLGRLPHHASSIPP